MIDLRAQLNPSQYKAVTTINGPVLVIAGAGSGKTRVIEYRVLHLVLNKIKPNSILLLTFTRKAAREMLSRAARHEPRCKYVDGGTFHSFAYKNLRRYARAIGLPTSFSVLDEADSEEAIHRCATRLGFYDREKRFPQKTTLKELISISVNKGVSIEDAVKKEYPHFLEYVEDIEAVQKEYAKYKIDKAYFDYDDLLVYLKALLKNQEVSERISQQYQYIMVDEYQDTNRLQGDIVHLLGAKHRNVMAVGDDAQSIYAFRGATHENIMEFPKRFPGCTIIKLEENYRSVQPILDVANAVLMNMKKKYPKCLISARTQKGEKPLLNFFMDADQEAKCVANKIKEINDNGTLLSHIGVLYRSADLSIPLQAELTTRNIPYQVFGGLKFYELAHVKDMMAHLKILINLKDELAWSRVLMLIKGIGLKTCERILEEIVNCSAFGEINRVFDKYKKHKYYDGLGRLTAALMASYGRRSMVGKQFEVILDYYTPILKDKFDDWHNRLNDLNILQQISARYDSLEELLADLALEPPEKGVARIDPFLPEEEKPLTLSTIHSAKGLEWESVFLIGLTDGCLPIIYALNDENDIEEEHRLFYVAITRAKNNLYLSMPLTNERWDMVQFNRLSRFIDKPNVLSRLELNDMTLAGDNLEL